MEPFYFAPSCIVCTPRAASTPVVPLPAGMLRMGFPHDLPARLPCSTLVPAAAARCKTWHTRRSWQPSSGRWQTFCRARLAWPTWRL